MNKDRIRMDGIKKYFEQVITKCTNYVCIHNLHNIQCQNAAKVERATSHSKNLELNGDESRGKLTDITNGASRLSISQHHQLTGGIVPSPQVSWLFSLSVLGPTHKGGRPAICAYWVDYTQAHLVQ